MRHVRVVNDVLAALSPPGSFTPALAVAAEVPGTKAGTLQPVLLRAATPAVIDDFIGLEAPSQSVDGLYGRILATLQKTPGTEEQQQTVRTVMAEGQDHWETFLAIKEWLGRHREADYLRDVNLQPPPAGQRRAPGSAADAMLALLGAPLYGLSARHPERGARHQRRPRHHVGPAGLQGALDAVAAGPFLVVFDPIADPRFAAIHPPDP